LWRQIHNLIVSTVKDTGSQEAKQLSNTFHSLQTQSELEKHENKGLRAALDTKKKRKEKKYSLDFGEPRENTGGATFFTPSKVKELTSFRGQKNKIKKQKLLEKQSISRGKPKLPPLRRRRKKKQRWQERRQKKQGR
jgi:hypothetical protein